MFAEDLVKQKPSETQRFCCDVSGMSGDAKLGFAVFLSGYNELTQAVIPTLI